MCIFIFIGFAKLISMLLFILPLFHSKHSVLRHIKCWNTMYILGAQNLSVTDGKAQKKNNTGNKK